LFRVSLIIILLSTFSVSPAQNLVANPSFETVTGCGGNGQMPQATGWNVPPGSITYADLYTTCASTGISCSDFNIYGSMAGCSNACQGNNYTGQIGYYTGCPNCREYLQRQLISPLVAGTTYNISFHTKLAPYARYAVNRMGMYLSAAAPAQPSSNQPIIVTPQIESGLVNDKINWTLVSGTYVAAGGENYVTIGIHYNNASLTIFDFGSSASGCALASAAAYYLVDNVWIAPVAGGLAPVCAPNSSNCINSLPVELTNFDATASGSGVKINWTTISEHNSEKFTVEYSNNGIDFSQVVSLPSKGGEGVFTDYEADHSDPKIGAAYYRLKQIDKDGSFTYTSLKQVNITEKSATVRIIPNPASDIVELNFYNASNGENVIEIEDVLGKVVLKENSKTAIGNTKVQIDVSELNAGIYFVKLSARDNKARVKLIKL
jgi:hypothetical protein